MAGGLWSELRGLSRSQRGAVWASFLGWTLDAFDFFILTFVISNVAHDFGAQVKDVSYALFLTLAMRPLGAFVFGVIADRYGRRPALMLDILLFTGFELASAFAPNLTVFLIMRALFGIAMGGEWGVGASLVMESIPPRTRGVISGFLQEGYAVGSILAAVANWVILPIWGWRGMFVAGALPALLVVYIRYGVEESPVWAEREHSAGGMWKAVVEHWRVGLYIILVMACFNGFSHGTQDLFPTFLKVQHKFPVGTVSVISIIASLGAICGGITFGAFSERIGRRRAIVIASLLALPMIPLWAFSQTVPLLALGAFLIQFAVQGAWGIVPVYLNELSPDDVRGTFPGFFYQLGNFMISLCGPIQAGIARARGDDYGFALAVTAGVVAIAISVVVGFGIERKDVVFGAGQR